MNRSYLRSIYLRLAGAMIIVVSLGLGASAYFSQLTFERALAPDMAKKVAVAAASTRALILEALEHNIPVREIYGIEQTFDDLKATVPDIAYAALTDAQGVVLFERFKQPQGAGAYFQTQSVLALMTAETTSSLSQRVDNQYIVSLPVASPQGAVGMLHIGVSVDFVGRIITDILIDVLVVLVVALFFTLELLHFMAGRRIEASLSVLGNVIERGVSGDFTTTPGGVDGGIFGDVVRQLESIRARVNDAFAQLSSDVDAGYLGPAHERPAALSSVRVSMKALAQQCRFGVQTASRDLSDENKLSSVRAPLFTFILAEELTRAFLPGYVKDLIVTVPWLSPEILVGLPIVLFMLIVALGQPFMGVFAARVGSRKAMMVGAAIAAVGLLASAMAASVVDLLLWRSLCAVGYGIVFVAAQAHVLEYSSVKNRARSFAVFIGAIMVATVCGPSIGGILADNIGERPTFIVAAFLALSSMYTIGLMPNKQATAFESAAPRMPTWQEISSLLFNARFMTVTGLAAMPAKMLLTGMCFYLMPLYLLSIGSTPTVAGRVLMVYGVVMVIAMPLAAVLATSRQRMETLVALGLTLSGFGGLALWFGAGQLHVYLAVLLVAMGQSMSIAAQSALVREHCDREVQVMGEAAVYGVYRLLERLGNTLGPIVAALLVQAVGYRFSFVYAGLAVLACGVSFFLITRMKRFGAQGADDVVLQTV